jgi:hypothetical protein
MNRTTYGLDIAKNVMQLHWIDHETGEIGRNKLARAKLSEFFAALQPEVKPTWLEALLKRRPANVVAVALANKMARTAWALVAHGRAYQSEWKSTPPGGCGAQALAA